MPHMSTLALGVSLYPHPPPSSLPQRQTTSWLTQSPGQDLYFYGNHPIKWVRIVGVVVGIDHFAGRRIYTVDDSSGTTIECFFRTPPPKPPTTSTPANAEPSAQQQQQRTEAKAQADATVPSSNMAGPTGPDIDAIIDVGDILDVRGGIGVFKEMKQVNVKKIIHLRSTEQEMRFWDKLAQFRLGVLDKPWTLDRREVRRCRKEAEGSGLASDRDRRKRRAAAVAAQAEKSNSRPRPTRDDVDKPAGPSTAPRLTGLERKTRRPRQHIQVEGTYSTLGI